MTKRTMPIEKLLHWAYADQRVHLNLVGSTARRQRGPNDDGDLERGIGVLASVSGHSHPDAVKLDRFVSVLRNGALVRKHGIAGTRPDWRENARHRFEPRVWVEVRKREGGIERLGESYETLPAPDHRYPNLAINDCGRRKRSDILEGRYDYVEMVQLDAPHEVMLVRSFYREWIAGLTGLRDAILAHSDSLSAYGVTAELPPGAPWESAQTQRILFAVNRSLTTG